MRLAIVSTDLRSNWYSCAIAERNLLRSYKAIQDLRTKVFVFDFSKFQDSSYKRYFLKKILSYNAEKIIFVDQSSFPLSAFNFLFKKISKNTEFIFHIYGDFINHGKKWKKNEKLLVGRPVRFLLASEKQKKYFDHFHKGATTQVCPFPVDAKLFKFKKISKRTFIEKSKTIHILFSGRITYQKNIIPTIHLLAPLLRSGKVQLYLAGGIDNQGAMHRGILDRLGEYQCEILATLKQLKMPFSCLHFLGHLPAEDLAVLYNEVDHFINLSTEIREDYGMAVAEALSCGCPGILTEWGGLSSFEIQNTPVSPHYIRTRIQSGGDIFFNDQDIRIGRKILLQKSTQRLRKLRAQTYQKKLSTQAVSELLKELFRTEAVCFQGFLKSASQLDLRNKTVRDYKEKVQKNAQLTLPYVHLAEEIYAS